MKKKILQAIVVIALFGSCLGTVIAMNVRKSMDHIRHYTAFFDVEGRELSESNVLKQVIAEKIGADCEESWLKASSKDEAVNRYIANGEYPDFISGGRKLYEDGALIPLDEYLDDYPLLAEYVDAIGRDKLRMEDGHIYWIPQYGVVKGKDSEVIHQGEAFWIQTRVLKWAGYPKVVTVEDYFRLIENYLKENPVRENERKNIGFTILCDDWKYFCLENPPQFLDGYPNDGCCIVDPKTLQVIDYNMTDTARRYFQILNEEYHRGVIDPESFTSTYEEYLDKLATGSVLGMVDQWWDFAYDIEAAYETEHLSEEGCSYVPLPITIDPGIKNQWHTQRAQEMDISSGISVTTSCRDVQGALQFMNDLLREDVQKLRFWGIEDSDYEVDENGRYYRTEEQRLRPVDQNLGGHYFCTYSYFPRFEGTYESGNSYSPEYQPEEFHDSLTEDVKECFDAYGAQTYVDLLGSNEQPGRWYPMYSYSQKLTYATEVGMVWKNMDEVKHEWLPRVVLTSNFDATWTQYQRAYEQCRPKVFFDALQQELEARMQ